MAVRGGFAYYLLMRSSLKLDPFHNIAENELCLLYHMKKMPLLINDDVESNGDVVGFPLDDNCDVFV